MARVAAAALAVGLVPGPSAGGRPAAPLPFAFPRDEGAHEREASEWWRVFGHVRAANGRRFDVSVTFFRFRTKPGSARDANAWGNADLFPATFVLVDEEAHAAHAATRLERGVLGFARAASAGLDLAVDGWTLVSRGSRDWRARRFTLVAADGDAAITLRQAPLKPPVALGNAGSLVTGSCGTCAARAYAYTRLRATGTVAVGGVTYAVAGRTWIDHEYATRELAGDDAGWDRFAIQLDDGRDVLLRTTRRRDGRPSPAATGTLVASNGRARRLDPHEFHIAVAGATHWVSPRTGVSYPSLWEVFVPSARLDLAVVPPVLDQEVAAPHGPAWFDGTADVERAPPPGGDTGQAFVELTGYDRPLVL